MDINKIRSEAPKGATHYRITNIGVEYYLKSLWCGNLKYDNGKWRCCMWSSFNPKIKPL